MAERFAHVGNRTLARIFCTLTVFNTSQRTIYYQNDNFTVVNWEAAGNALHQAKLAVVDYKTLKNLRTSLQFLNELLIAEDARQPRPSAVVFLGPYSPEFRKSSPEPAIRPPSGLRVFYLQHQPPARLVRERHPIAAPGGLQNEGPPLTLAPRVTLPPPDLPDPIAQLVHLAKGKTLTIYKAEDFTHALHRIPVFNP